MRENLRAVRARVGRNIGYLRRLHGLSQERLAELVGRSPKYLGQVERGQVNVSLDVLTSIAAGLSVTVGDLFRSTQDNASATRLYMIPQREFDAFERSLRAVMKAKRAARAERAERS